jgi:hypothetical protein
MTATEYFSIGALCDDLEEQIGPANSRKSLDYT